MIPIKYQIVNLRLPGRWNGVAVQKWSNLSFQPEKLTQQPEKIFKTENSNITALMQIEFNGKIPFVIKKTVRRAGIRAFADFLQIPKSLKNLKLALTLNQNNIEVAQPVAALWHRKLGCIYITEYIENSINLYEVGFGKDKEILENFLDRKTVIRQVAEIIAKLHKSGFWHRDSKAGNFIVYKDFNIYRVKLIDLDGIKQDYGNDDENRVRTLSKLAETLVRFKTINFTDLYRGFLIYCRSMELDYIQSRELFQKVQRSTIDLRLQTLISDSYKLK